MCCVIHIHTNIHYGPFKDANEARKWARTRFGKQGWNMYRLQTPDTVQKTRMLNVTNHIDL